MTRAKPITSIRYRAPLIAVVSAFFFLSCFSKEDKEAAKMAMDPIGGMFGVIAEGVGDSMMKSLGQGSRQLDLHRCLGEGGQYLPLPYWFQLTADEVRMTLQQLSQPDYRWVQRLRLSGTNVTDQGLTSVRQLQLTHLYLDDTQITDQGLFFISGMPLVELDLFGTHVTDKGVQTLAQIRTLQSLNLKNTAVSAAARQKLLAQIPGLKIAYCAKGNSCL